MGSPRKQARASSRAVWSASSSSWRNGFHGCSRFFCCSSPRRSSVVNQANSSKTSVSTGQLHEGCFDIDILTFSKRKGQSTCSGLDNTSSGAGYKDMQRLNSSLRRWESCSTWPAERNVTRWEGLLYTEEKPAAGKSSASGE